MNEELIFATLFERIASVRWTRDGDDPDARQFVTMSRRVKLFAEVPIALQPACFQAEHRNTEGQITGMPYKTILNANWIIYQAIGVDKSAIGAIENNLIIAGCREALKPLPNDPGYLDKRNTLNGLVHHCFISGTLFKDPGDLDDQGMIVIPIKLLVP